VQRCVEYANGDILSIIVPYLTDKEFACLQRTNMINHLRFRKFRIVKMQLRNKNFCDRLSKVNAAKIWLLTWYSAPLLKNEWGWVKRWLYNSGIHTNLS